VAKFFPWLPSLIGVNFDIIHDHTRFHSTLFAHLLPILSVSTVHHPVEFDELHWHHPAADERQPLGDPERNRPAVTR
jgi:hypothetical protein